MFKRTILWLAVAGLVFAISPVAQAALTGQLGLLDLTKDYGFGPGINPGTGSPWILGDVYHLTYVTSAQRDSTSTDIFDYNTFVQADAEAAGIGASAGVKWFVLGSTATVNAKDNAVVTGPIFNIYGSNCVGKNAADFWDLVFPTSNPILTLAGSPKNTHTGTVGGGTVHSGYQLGNPTVRLAWTGWQNWSAAWRGDPATALLERVAISTPLKIVADVAYWDLNGTAEGAGGATPAGTWDAAGANWNPLAIGTGAVEAWSAGYTAAFGAGGDATGTYTVAVDGTQDICGLSFEEGTVTLAPGTDGALRMVFSSTADVAAGLTATVQPAISEDATARSLVKRGEGTLILSGANTYTGTTVVNEGTLVLSGSPTGQSNTTVNGGGTLKLDYSTNDTGKIHDSAVLTLGGGTLELAGGTHAEVVASTTIAAGLSSVNRSSGSATLAMNTITSGPGIVNFAAPGIATTDNTNTNGILGPWATVGKADWAQNSTDAADGPITAYTGYTDIAATGDTITDGVTTNVRLNSEGSGGNLALSADTTAVNTLLQNTTTASTVDTALKTLQTGGIMIGAGQEAVTIGAAAGDGTLTGASAGGVLYLNNNNAAKTLTVNAVIANNTSPSALATAGNVLLRGVNTYTGATYVNAGALEIGGAGQLAGGAYSAGIAIARGATFKYNSSASQVLSGGISGSGSLLKDAAGTLTLSGANTWTGATTISGGTLQIGNGAGTGSLSPSSAITNNATLAFNRSNVITQGVDFAYSISGSGDVTQAGPGILVLSGTNTYTGMTVVKAGALVPDTTSSLPGHDSAGKVVFDGGTVRILVGGGWGTADVDTLLANATRNSGALGIDTFHGDLTQWTAFTPANMGALGLTKYGVNALTLDQANTHTGGTTLAGGTLVIGNAGALGAGAFTIAGASTVQAAGTVVITNPVAANSNFTIGGTDALTLGGTMTLSANRTITNNNNTSTTTFGDISGAAASLTFSGNGNTVVAGPIATTSGVTKNGTGTLTLSSAASTYTGATNIAAGTLIVSKLADGGQPSSIGQSSNVSTNLLIGNGATLRYTGAGDSTDRLFRFNGNLAGLSITLDASGSGPINFTNTGSPTHSNNNQVRTLNLIGSNTGENTLALTIANDGSQPLSIVKDGEGTWVLAGANTYTGGTTVNGGTLLVNGNQSLATGAVAVNVNGTLGGTGTLGGAVTVNNDGAVVWDFNGTTGNTHLALLSNLELDAGWKVTLTSSGAGTPSGEYDLFTYTGSFTGTLAGIIDDSAVTGWPTPTIGQDESGTVNRIYLKFGTPGDTNADGVVDAADYMALKMNFGMSSGATVADGDFNESGSVNWADLNILTGNIGSGSGAPGTAPEPGSAMLLVFGAAALLRRRGIIGKTGR